MIAFFLNLRIYLYIAAACLIVGYVAGCEGERQRGAEFKGGVEALGRAAQESADRIAAKNIKSKKDTQNENAGALRTLADMYADADRKLHERPSGGYVPSTGGSPGRPEGEVCFDQAELDRRIDDSVRRLQSRTQAILRKGDEALIDRWSWGSWYSRTTAPP